MTAVDTALDHVPFTRTRHRPGRTQHLRPSAIRALAADAPVDVLDLGLGEPRWDLPAAAREALTPPEESRSCGYGPAEGLPELRSAVARHHRVEANQVMIGAGAQGVLFSLLHTYAGLGDLVAVPDPGFPGYRTLAQVAGATPVTYPLADDGALDLVALVEVLRRHRPAVLVLNLPGNPTGSADAASLRTVLATASEHDVLVISDEVYRDLHTGPEPRPSAVDLAQDVPPGPGVLTVSSVSKAWAAPGLRVGWAIGPAEVLAPARLLHQTMTTSVSRPAQLAATALLEASDTVLSASRAALRSRWEVVGSSPLAASAVAPAQAGGFYVWAAIPRDHLDPIDGDATEAHARWLRDRHGVLTVPGTAFGSRGAGHLRIGLGSDLTDLREGLRRIGAAWGLA